jgi:hypothetical protein
MRNYKKKSKCPPLLCEIIELINLLPENAQEIFDNVCDEGIIRRENGAIVEGSAVTLFDKNLVEYIFDQEPITESVQRFEDLLKAKSLFNHFAQLNKKVTSPGGKYLQWETLKSDGQKQYEFLLQFLTIDYKKREFTVSLGFTKDGYIKPAKSLFIALFEEFDIPIYRIRSCEVCSSIFWAKRTDALTCESKKCSDILRQRRYQENKRAISEKQKANKSLVKKGIAKQSKRK